MKKKHFRKVKIYEGEDTPCKSCDVYRENGCSGNCSLIRRWKRKPTTITLYGKPYKTTYIDGYVYKKI